MRFNRIIESFSMNKNFTRKYESYSDLFVDCDQRKWLNMVSTCRRTRSSWRWRWWRQRRWTRRWGRCSSSPWSGRAPACRERIESKLNPGIAGILRQCWGKGVKPLFCLQILFKFWPLGLLHSSTHCDGGRHHEFSSKLLSPELGQTQL